jgi:hypothetical protein
MTGRLNETELHKLYQKQTIPVRQAGEVRRAGLFGLVRGAEKGRPEAGEEKRSPGQVTGAVIIEDSFQSPGKSTPGD